MEVGVGGADFGKSVLQHQRRGVQIVHGIPRQPRMPPRELAHDVGMTLGFREDATAGARPHG